MITFKWYDIAKLPVMNHLLEIYATLSESAENNWPTMPLTEILELVYQCPMLLLTVLWKIRPETDLGVNHDN